MVRAKHGGLLRVARHRSRVASVVFGALGLALAAPVAQAAQHSAHASIRVSPIQVGRSPVPPPDRREPVPAHRHAVLLPHRAASAHRVGARPAPPGGPAFSEISAAEATFGWSAFQGLRSRHGRSVDIGTRSERGPPCCERTRTNLCPPNLDISPPLSIPGFADPILVLSVGPSDPSISGHCGAYNSGVVVRRSALHAVARGGGA